MADERRLAADDVATRAFATSFRGFEPSEVRAYLGRLAEELRAAAEREEALTARLAEAEARASSPEIDEDTLLRLLGDETARVMRSAREAAADLKAHAEENVEQILRDAHEQAARLRAGAESVLAERTAEAEEAASRIRMAAEEQAAGLLEAASGQAEAVLNEAREQGRAMVVEAQAARERILADLNRRRRIAHVQVEQLRAGRDRLLDAYRLVRSTLEEVTEELQRAEHEARHAAEATARRLAAEAPELAAEAAEPDEAEPAAPVLVTEATPADGGDGDKNEEAAEGESEHAAILLTTTVEAESLTPVTAEPSRPASIPVEERRLSSLRVLRRVPDPEPEPVPAGAPPLSGELDVVEPPATDEAVRIIEPEPEPLAEVPKAEDIFARIRASREAEVEKARAVLAEPEPEAEPAAAPAVSNTAVSDADERALQQRDEAVADIERGLARKLKRSLQDEQNDLLDRLRGVRGAPAESALPDPAEHGARHAAVALPFLRQAAGAELDVDDVAAALAESITGPLRRQLERAVRPPGDDEDVDVAERIGMAYREWKGDRIDRLASDAVLAAWARARFAEAPDGAPLRWIVDDGGQACPDCDDNSLAGPTAKGEEFPTGQQHPPAHAGCRCLLVRAAT